MGDENTKACGAAPLSQERKEEFEKFLNSRRKNAKNKQLQIRVTNGYGMTVSFEKSP
jgi:hypothetical protein